MEAALDFEPLFITRKLALGLGRWWRVVRGADDASTWPVLVLFASIPLALDLILRVADAGSSWRGLVWGAMGTLLSSALLISAAWGWPRVRDLAGPIEAMLGLSDGGHRPEREGSATDEHIEYVAQVARRLQINRWHYGVCCGVAVAGVGSVYFGSTQLPRHTIGPGYFLSIAVLAVLGTDSIRWMLRTPLVIVQPLTKLERLTVVMHSPATTPAIRKMGAVAARTATRAGIGFFLFGLPALWAVLAAKPGGHPISHLEQLALLGTVPLAVTTAVVIYVVFVPQMWLSEIVERQRDRILDELALELPEEGPANLLDTRTGTVMALYDELAGTSTETAAARTIARRTVAVIAVLLPQLLGVGSKLLHLA